LVSGKPIFNYEVEVSEILINNEPPFDYEIMAATFVKVKSGITPQPITNSFHVQVCISTLISQKIMCGHSKSLQIVKQPVAHNPLQQPV
jgi:hypothetical protein